MEEVKEPILEMEIPHVQGHVGLDLHDPGFVKVHGDGREALQFQSEAFNEEEAQQSPGLIQADFKDDSSAGSEKRMRHDDDEGY
jgi:hypothetical protein